MSDELKPTDDQCDRIVALTMDKLAAKGCDQYGDMHALDLNPNIMEHHSLRRGIVRAAYGIGEAEAIAAWNRRAQPAAPADAAPSVAPEPLHVDETKRYRVVQKGYWWRVQIGDGQQTVGRCFSQTEAQHLAHALVVAYRDGFFVASLSAHPPRAPLTEEQVTEVYEVSSGQPLRPQDKESVFAFAYAIEAAHGIGGK